MVKGAEPTGVWGRHSRARTAPVAALVICMLAAFYVLAIPAAKAETSVAVEGKMVWDLNTLKIIKSLPANGNTILWGTTTVFVTGSFAGTATDTWTETLFQTGALSLRDVLTVSTSVDGKSGTLTLLLVGRAAPPGAYWTGQWTILSGTDDLATISGHGTWWTAEVGYDYSGFVEFE